MTDSNELTDNQELGKAKLPTPCSTLGGSVTAKEAGAELMACLTLVAPVSMTAEDRAAWVAVAMQTLSGLTSSQLRKGCQQARETCRFPSEIVPTVLGNAPQGQNRPSKYISESGFVYYGDEDEVMRLAEKRADWTTYWFAASNRNRARLPSLRQ